jgi:hypothetical protein
MPEGLTAKMGTPVSAAMETAGAVVQSQMLDFVTGEQGLLLGGLLYLIAIASAIIVFAGGGNYRWGRYLLVGPTLFMFLTTVRSESDGTEWSWGQNEFSTEAVEYALRGIVDTGEGGGGDARVSTVFHFWNVFMSEVVHSLINLLQFDTDDNNFNFVNKVEKYMGFWNFSQIQDPDLRMMIRTVLAPECSEYFYHLYESNKVVTIERVKQQARELAEQKKDLPIFTALDDTQHSRFSRDVWEWMKLHNLTDTTHTCDSLWKELLKILKVDVAEVVESGVKGSLAHEQDEEISKEVFDRKIGEYVGRYRGKIKTSQLGNDAATLSAVNWIIARSLALELGTVEKYSRTHLRDNASAINLEDGGAEVSGGSSGYTQNSSASIQQFNQAEEHGMRSLFITAAMSLPYVQGVGLLILSATFPFFAMLLIIPGRAAGIFTWFSLWAWLKLWDLGYAVVTMIDNMLYSMFPRGPNISDDEIENLGLAMVKAFEVDPNYSYATYYNIIATCMLAVPLVSGVFVKGGGNELVNIFHNSWSDYSYRISGGVMSFARSMQAQNVMKSLQELRDEEFRKATIQGEAEAKKQKLYSQLLSLSVQSGVMGAIAGIDPTGAAAIQKADVDARRESVREQIRAIKKNSQDKAMFRIRQNEARFYGNVANMSRYYSHELSQGDLPYRSELGRELAKNYYDVGKVIGAVVGQGEKHVKTATGEK